MSSKRLRILGIILVVVALGSIVLAACARPGTATGGNNGPAAPSCPSGPAVHLTARNFAVSCVNITKGSKLMLIDDVQVLHIITNGMWDSSGNQVTTKEPGAPTISNVNISGGQADIGPFTTAGTYHILCTVHPGMNLVVNVK